jgi:hypothetical protein
MCKERQSTYIADTPSDGTLFTCGGTVIGLAVDTQVHDVIATDGAVVDDDIPCPEGDSVPLRSQSCQSRNFAMQGAHPPARIYLLDFKSLLSVGVTSGGCDLLALGSGGGRVGHFHVRHLCAEGLVKYDLL